MDIDNMSSDKIKVIMKENRKFRDIRKVKIVYNKNRLYLKPEYFNKESRGVTYLKLDYRYMREETGWSYGLTTRTIDGTDISGGWETLYSLGYKKVKKTGNVEVEVSFNGYYGESFEYEDIFKVTYILSKNTRLYN